jgi:methionine aminopeptidase
MAATAPNATTHHKPPKPYPLYVKSPKFASQAKTDTFLTTNLHTAELNFSCRGTSSNNKWQYCSFPSFQMGIAIAICISINQNLINIQSIFIPENMGKLLLEL